MTKKRLDKIKLQTCHAPRCGRLGRGRFCVHHRSLFRYYGAPVAGPTKQLLEVHQRYLRKSLGPLIELDQEVHNLILQIADIAFEPRPMHFKGARPSRTLWASYEAVTGQVLRIRQCHPGETNTELAERLWWAFLTTQCLELSSIYVHQDRHHFWTSVVRLLLTDSHGQKPSSRYADYLDEWLNTLLSTPAAKLCTRVKL
ncbi:hypothetical protein [uncultured Roseibium sp.]|uniref:hypothetical protein n=1 Tax=uncultured Roseibium sp. TaxID=1936171 RepID=UPI00321745C9